MDESRVEFIRHSSIRSAYRGQPDSYLLNCAHTPSLVMQRVVDEIRVDQQSKTPTIEYFGFVFYLLSFVSFGWDWSGGGN